MHLLFKMVAMLMLGVFCSWNSTYAILFRDQSSTIHLTNGSSYYQSASNPITGTIKLSFDSSINSFSAPLYFDDGIYSENGADLILTGTLDPSQTYSIRLAGQGNAKSQFDANFRVRTRISGAGNVLEGRPKFLTSDALELAGAGTELRIGTQGDFTSSILMNNGSIILNSDLQLGEEVVLTGSGNVSLAGNNIIFGTTATTWTSTLRWVNANNINVGGQTRMPGNWTFEGSGTIIGGNNILDISSTGTIRIKANSNIELNNLVIQGLGTGTIYCDDNTASLTLKNCVINLDRSYTVTSGQWIVANPSKIITGNNFLRFLTSSQLSVDAGSSLEYDTLSANDNNNIVLLDGNPVSNCGTIVFAQKLPLGPYRFAENITLDTDRVVTVLRNLQIVDNVTIDGAQFSLNFARHPLAPIFTIAANKKATFTNISLNNFPVDSGSISFGSDSELILGNQTTIELGDSATLTTTWQCVGATVVYGNGKVLTLGANGNIVLSPGASILFDNITLNNVHGYNIKCMDDRCTVSFGSVLWQQDNNYSFTCGKLYVRDILELLGTSTFNYATTQTSTIASLGELKIGKGMTFKYNPPTANKRQLFLTDALSYVTLDSGCLAVTTTGMRLTKGTLYVSGNGILRNNGAVSQSQGIIFGDGNPDNDLNINLAPSATLDVQSGILLFDQV
ncbi:hypothetical protein FJ365_02140 [Candidatus Dependentiae bacterium]|nr:hypothetical protein [Candidatus Dependentiae bacterium]